ncbi:formate dehydrogenase accessory sulfurtransferase FdhD [Jatrophihabitans sp. YIM 134969]
MAIATTRRAVVAVRPDVAPRQRPDDLAVEAPLSLVLDETVIATLMRTPGHDVELAAGWLVVESGVTRRDDVEGLAEVHAFDLEPDRVVLRLAPGVEPPRPRAYVTSAACGVCSADVLDLAGTRPPGVPAATDGWTVASDVLVALPDTMREHQRAFDRTGGVHAAAVATPRGELLVVREDVGRHNAVDKVVGHALLEGPFPLTDHLLVVSGRVSFEIVQKAVAAGVSAIVAVSAPSSLAVDLAREHGVLLAGLVRGGRMNLYAEAERVV